MALLLLAPLYAAPVATAQEFTFESSAVGSICRIDVRSPGPIGDPHELYCFGPGVDRTRALPRHVPPWEASRACFDNVRFRPGP